MNIKHIVKNNTVRFVRYRKGVAYYCVDVPMLGPHLFPVQVSDVGDATLAAEDKAILFMRYIRLAMAEQSLVPLAS